MTSPELALSIAAWIELPVGSIVITCADTGTASAGRAAPAAGAGDNVMTAAAISASDPKVLADVLLIFLKTIVHLLTTNASIEPLK
jgi:hypothetical protein